jgi:hypothetical protein
MANYSWVSGMENRGLNWQFIKMDANNNGTNIIIQQGKVSTGTNAQAKYLGDPLAFGIQPDLIILENYIVSSGNGLFLNAVLVYDTNDPRRLPGDGIRFHNGGSFIAAKPL